MRALAIVILVMGLVLAVGAPAAAVPDTPAERSGRVTADRLNLRGSPSTAAEVISAMAHGETVTILEEQGEWYRLQLADGRTGWAAARYIEITAEAPAEAPADESEIPSSARDAEEAMRSDTGTSRHRGGSFLGGVLKWGCLLGAGACGFLAYDEYSKGNSSYDDYETAYSTEYNRPTQPQRPPLTAHQDALVFAEPLRVDAEDHDQMSKTYAAVAGGLGALFLVQQLFLGGGDDEQASLEPVSSPPAPLLACGLRDGQVRAAVTLARF